MTETYSFSQSMRHTKLCMARVGLATRIASPVAIGLVIALGSYSFAQESPAKPASSLAGSIKIVKLLWKSNPKSAATTLAKSLAVALERDQQSELSEVLAPLKEQLEQAIASDSDPRFGVSLAALAIIHRADAATGQQLRAAIDKGESENLELLVRTWFVVDPESAFSYLSNNLVKAPKALPIVMQTALASDRNRAAAVILEQWKNIPREQQFTAIEPLSAQASTMLKLVEAVKAGVVNKELVNTNQLRKWQSSGNAQLTTAIESVWGRIRESDNEERQKLVQKRLKLLRGKNSQGVESQGSVARGQLVFNRVCAQCHQLHGAGLEVGPSITNNGRGNLDQLVSNILDPSLVIGNAFQARTVLTVDGEVVAGLVVADDERFLRIKVQGGKVLEFDKSKDIEQIKVSDKSLMPDGLEEQMTEQEFIDLCALLCLVKSPTESDNELIPGTPSNLVNP
ncbi:MAG: c-type cytochrome [Pirellulaceae bacterium]|nr:c-type cytochrome [Pirellulaceae bacterium]